VVVDEWVRQGWLVEGAGGWAGPGLTADAVGVPESLRARIERQLEAISTEDQRVLEAASVVGMAGSAAAVAAGVEMEVEEVEERCAGLARCGQFLQASGSESWPDGTVAGCYTFRHALYQQVVYAQLPATRRRRLHRRIGERVEAGYGAAAGDRAAELALHFERGGDDGRAVAFRRQAAANALGRWAYQEVIEHLTRGLEVLQQLPDTPELLQQELDIQTMLGRALMVTRGYTSSEAMQAYTRAHVLCRQVGDARQLFRVLRGLQLFHLVRGELQKAHEIAEQLLTIAESLPDRTLLPDAHRALGEDLFLLGELARARTHLEQGIALYAPQRHSDPAVRVDRIHGLACYHFGAWTLWLLGYPDQALQRAQQALVLADALSTPEALAAVLFGAAALHQFRGEVQAAQQQAEALVALSREHRFALGSARGTILWGWALAEQGQGAEGLSRIHEGLAAFRAMGVEPMVPYCLALLAEAYGKGADVKDGLTVLAEALAMVPKAGGDFYEAELYRLKGELLLAHACQRQTAKRNRHMAEEGDACFQQALAVARRQEAKSLELRAATSLSRLWQRQGRRADARQLLAPIYSWFTEGFDTADVQEAQVLLSELS
jgi:predicted ATPase